MIDTWGISLLMKRMVNVLKVLAIISVVSASVALAEEGYITICSFTISELGASSENKDHRAIADMIDDFDLIVIQEVMDNGGAEHIQAIVDSMNVNAHRPYTYFIIPRAGRGFPGYEGYAYIYREPVVPDEAYSPSYGLKETTVNYGRIPGWAYFKAGNFDFLLVGIHLHWSDLDKRMAEDADLLSWLKEYAEKPDTEERDLIIAGNTNRFGGYSETKIRNRETAFHQLLDDESLNEKYRLLFCEHLPVPDAKEADTDAGSTTVSDSNNMVYDQIIISSGNFHEFGDAPASLGNSIGIIDFDNSPEFSSMETEAIKDLVSDHRPIYARFRIDLEDDDGLPVFVEENSTPISTILFDNYPNPFNPRTTISYFMQFPGDVKLSIYTISGQELCVLAEGFRHAGYYSHVWNAQGLSNGIYICTLSTGGCMHSTKMLLMK